MGPLNTREGEGQAPSPRNADHESGRRRALEEFTAVREIQKGFKAKRLALAGACPCLSAVAGVQSNGLVVETACPPWAWRRRVDSPPNLIGWTFLERAFWGGAHNLELKSLMLDHAFRFVQRVVFVVGEKNFRSQQALRKIGAKFLRKKELPAADGTVTSHLVFAITRRTEHDISVAR